MTQSPDVTAAKRRMLGYIRNRGVLDPEHGALVLWSEDGCGAWKADADELSQDLMLLGVPHYTTITGMCQPPWRSASTHEPPARWEKIWITRGDLPGLLAELPSLRKAIDLAALPDVRPEPGYLLREGNPAPVPVLDGELLGRVAGTPAGLPEDFP